MRRVAAWLFAAFLASCFQPSLVLAGQWSYVSSSKQGHLYLAGTAPKLLAVKPAGKVFFRSKDKKYCQKFYVIYRRSNRDQGNRTYPVIKAHRWENIIDWIDSRGLYKKLPFYELIRFWNKSMPYTSHWKKPFPTLRAIITYNVANEVGLPGWSNMRLNKGKPKKTKVMVDEWVWNSKWWITGRYKKVPRQKWRSQPPQRTALGKDKIKEELVYALPPGKHKLEIRGHVGIDKNHPMVRFKKIYDWKKYAKSPIEIIVDKIAGVLSVKELFKGTAASYAQKTVSTYTLNIPAITPTLKGIHKKAAYKRVKQWSLRPKFKMKNTSNRSLHEKVASQTPMPGTLLAAGSTVQFTYWVYKPKPKPKRKQYSKTSYAGDISGTWDTNLGQMTLFKEGDSITGTYSSTKIGSIVDTGTITGKIKGRTFTGFWIKTKSTTKCQSQKNGSYYWGGIKFKFTKTFTKFDGSWSYCAGGGGGSWNGSRSSK
jgi:hypothetical protein